MSNNVLRSEVSSNDSKAIDRRIPQMSETDIIKFINRHGSNFKWIIRLKAADLSPEIYKHYVIDQKVPICVEGVTQGWNRELFSWTWLRDNHGDTELINSPRDVNELEDLQGWTLRQYIDYFLKPSEQRDRKLYGKDIPCPETWRVYLTEKLFPYFSGTADDLVGDVDKELQPIALMVHLSYESLWVPGHKPICGSLGHDLMVYGEPEACSFWFCTLPNEKEKVASFWKKHGQSIDHDNYFMSLEQLALADFSVYVCKQREGDFVIVPPEGAHQIVHAGGRRVAVAWNRITPLIILNAFRNVLPLYHTLCKTEVFRLKTLAYYGLIKRVNSILNNDVISVTLAQELPPLIQMVDEIIESEWIEEDIIQRWKEPLIVTKFTDDVKHSRACNYCNCDIFNRCYHCSQCQSDYDVCLNCMAEGRGCVHNVSLTLMEYLSMRELRTTLHHARVAYTVLTAKLVSLDPSKQSFIQTIDKFTYRDEYSIASIAYDMAQHYKFAEGKTEHCHQCKIHKPLKYIVRCRKNANDPEKRCKLQYCAMCLWNRYAIRFFLCRKNKTWQCPSCMQICNCAACLRARKINPREHKLNIEVESLEEMSVYLPPAFHENNCEALPGPCDRKPKGVRTSYGWTEEEMRVARLKKRQGGLHGSDCECDASPSSDVKSSGSLSEHSQNQDGVDESDSSSKLLTLIRVLQYDLSDKESTENEHSHDIVTSTPQRPSISTSLPQSPQSLANPRKRHADTRLEQDVDISLETPTLKRQKFQELERPLVSTSTPLPNENISNIENRLLLRRVVESVSHTPNTLHILNNFIATAAHYRNLSPTQLLETIFTPSPNEPMISASSPLVNSEKYSRTSQREPLNDADFDWNSGFLFAPLVYGPLWPAVRIRKEAYFKILPSIIRVTTISPININNQEQIMVFFLSEPYTPYAWVNTTTILPFAEFYVQCWHDVMNNKTKWSSALQRRFHTAVELARDLYNKHHPERQLTYPISSWFQLLLSTGQLSQSTTTLSRYSDLPHCIQSHVSPYFSTVSVISQPQPRPLHSPYTNNTNTLHEDVSNSSDRSRELPHDPLTGQAYKYWCEHCPGLGFHTSQSKAGHFASKHPKSVFRQTSGLLLNNLPTSRVTCPGVIPGLPKETNRGDSQSSVTQAIPSFLSQQKSEHKQSISVPLSSTIPVEPSTLSTYSHPTHNKLLSSLTPPQIGLVNHFSNSTANTNIKLPSSSLSTMDIANFMADLQTHVNPNSEKKE